MQCLFSFRTDVNETPLGFPDDSDTSVSVDLRSGESNDAPSDGPANDDTETNDDDSSSPSGDWWEEDKDFHPTLPLQMQKFNKHFTSSGQSRRHRTGLQCSPIDINSPMRAWREVFKTSLLDKIVNYTNDYGRVNAKRWQDITRKDLEAFIAVLFVSSVQKRKDKPSNWFSDNRILESQVMKKIMSG